ncbi:hypothetical protein [uncultured Cellulomonas sp.]|uniref:hypothetical protein n=1 Tax=uncultured Cellulomonas sp. TaxID=189682 RepID=UPI0028ED69BA|nr:hypothetical protein [uncultured Cellulomonas sp.]
MAGPVTTGRVLAAEWTKLTGLRSSLWVGLSTVAAAACLAWALGLFVRAADGHVAATVVASGYLLAQLGALVLGVLVGTGEFVAGTFRATFTAVPRRLLVLAAQVLVTAAVALVTAVAALLVSLLVTTGQRSALGLTIDVADPETLRVLTGYVLYLTGVALLGLGLGALLRRPTGALVSGVMLLVVIDQVLVTNPGRLTDTARALLPGSATRLLQDDSRLATLDATTLGPHLGPWGSALVLGVWVVALLLAAGYRLRRHDLA